MNCVEKRDEDPFRVLFLQIYASLLLHGKPDYLIWLLEMVVHWRVQVYSRIVFVVVPYQAQGIAMNYF
jgi:hypothetical protein